MLNFTQWVLNEIAELKKPKNSVKMRRFVTNPGTNTAKPAIEYKFKTSLNNEVRVHFKHNGIDEYEIVFYVNNHISDDAKIDNKERDPEILSGVFYIVKEKAKKLGAKILSFTATKTEKDNRIIRNLKLEPVINISLFEIDKMFKILENYQVKMISPSEGIAKLLRLQGKPTDPRPDIDIPKSNLILNKLKKIILNLKTLDITNKENVYQFLIELNELYSKDLHFIKHPEMSNVLESVKNLINALYSNTPYGLNKTLNRRKNIYENLIKRYFLDNWNVESAGDRFYLTRKENEF